MNRIYFSFSPDQMTEPLDFDNFESERDRRTLVHRNNEREFKINCLKCFMKLNNF